MGDPQLSLAQVVERIHRLVERNRQAGSLGDQLLAFKFSGWFNLTRFLLL